MFREMRKKNQSLDRAECLRILNERENGVMALSGDEGYPYAVPLNHVLVDGKLYFHCATEGHKIDAIRSCDKASFCVIDADDVDAEAYTTRFRSVIVFGRVRLVEDDGERLRALMAIGNRFCPATPEKTDMEIRGAFSRTGIIEMDIEHISGKESRALAMERRKRTE